MKLIENEIRPEDRFDINQSRNYKLSRKSRLCVRCIILSIVVVIVIGLVASIFQRYTDEGESLIRLCKVSDSADPLAASAVDKQLDLAPKQVIEAFAASEWIIEVVDDAAIKEHQHAGHPPILGLTYPNEKKILISDDPGAAEGVVAHELGHWLDIVSGNLSEKVGLEEALYSGDGYLTSLVVDPFPADRHELFANVFEAYVQRGYLMRVLCPDLYAYVESCIGNL